MPDFSDFDIHERPFPVADLIEVLQQISDHFVGRSGNGTGNLCVYDASGNYVGVLDLNDLPDKLMMFGEE